MTLSCNNMLSIWICSSNHRIKCYGFTVTAFLASGSSGFIKLVRLVPTYETTRRRAQEASAQVPPRLPALLQHQLHRDGHDAKHQHPSVTSTMYNRDLQRFHEPLLWQLSSDGEPSLPSLQRLWGCTGGPCPRLAQWRVWTARWSCQWRWWRSGDGSTHPTARDPAHFGGGVVYCPEVPGPGWGGGHLQRVEVRCSCGGPFVSCGLLTLLHHLHFHHPNVCSQLHWGCFQRFHITGYCWMNERKNM